MRLPGLATRQAATVRLLGQACGPGRLDAEGAAACWLVDVLGGRLAHRLGGCCGRLGERLRGNFGSRLSGGLGRLGRLAQLGQRRRLVQVGSSRVRLGQRALAGLAGYVLGRSSADQGLTAAAAGRIKTIGGIVGNQNLTSPMR